MFHIKICGVRRGEDIQGAADAGADAVGLNFFPDSIRFVDPHAPSTAELSRLASERGLVRVGLFVNLGHDQIARVADAVGIDAIQLHGDESLEFAKQLIRTTKLPLIRAVKLPTGTLQVSQIDQAVQPWVNLGCHPLFDAEAGAAHGGSGLTLDWDSIQRWNEDSRDTVFTLAGGLNPENVAKAIERSGARSVDTASGVERPKGIKNRERMGAFVRECQRGLRPNGR